MKRAAFVFVGLVLSLVGMIAVDIMFDGSSQPSTPTSQEAPAVVPNFKVQ